MISVVLPTRNPHPGRLAQTLAGLAAQTLARGDWELVVVDNGSSPAIGSSEISALGGRLIVEPAAGLTRARLAGIRGTRGELLVFVDDDNVLGPGFLEHARDLFRRETRLGAAGGPVLPAFEQPPPDWTREFFGLLALRDLGPAALRAAGGAAAPWPRCAPVGAGLCVRRAAVDAYTNALASDDSRLALDRAGRSLASGGDSDLVFTALHAGWDVGYFPELGVTHLIPAARLDRAYLARLNRGIMRTWVRVLHLHGQCPWPAISRATVAPRVARAWLRQRAWRGPAEWVRWHGARGQFEGQADLARR